MADPVAQAPQILFVDDEENILKSVRRLFLDEPVEVFTASSGEEALGLLTHNRGFAVIVSDQRMPGMSGAEFLEKAKELVPDAVRIVLTGYADVKAAVDAINKGGAARYIGKPWNDEELIAVVRDATSRNALVRENRRLTEIVHRQNAELRRWNSQLEVMVQQQTMELSKMNEELKRINERLKSNFRDIIESLAGLLELRDQSTLNHSRNVSEMSVQAAWALGLPAAEVEQITVASLLHDIGKIGMSDLLLLKDPDAMTSEERKEYMRHPVRGQSAIYQIEDLRPAGVLIRHHHEAYNGTGFPDGLKAEDIPLGSRIIAAANYFEMKFSRSSDPNALSLAMNALREQAGKTLDPEVCRVLEKPLREKFAKAPSRAGAVEREIPLRDLATGMIASRDIRSGTGVLLLKKSAVLDAKTIEAIKRYEQVDPATSGVYVWVGK